MRNKIKLIILIIFIVCIISKITYAKFINNINIFYETQIAKPIFILDGAEKININNENAENVKSYIFTLKNYDEENISEINLEYFIEIYSTFKDSKIDYELYKITNEKEELVENYETKVEIKANQKYEQQYKLYIFTNNEETINEKIYVRAIAEQTNI